MYALIQNGQITQYPYNLAQLKQDNPNVSFPSSPSAQTLNDFGMHIVVAKGQPEHDRLTQVANELTPAFNEVKAQWEQQWEVVDLDAESAAANQAAAANALQTSIVAATQASLDDFAKTRNYDSILSACTYATSVVSKFSKEGQHCVNMRDQTWETLYNILDEVKNGTRPMPTSFADIEAELPVLQWAE